MIRDWLKRKVRYSTFDFSIMIVISTIFIAPATYRLINITLRNGGIPPIDIISIWTVLVTVNILALRNFRSGIIVWTAILLCLGIALTTTYETHPMQAAIGCSWVLSSLYLLLRFKKICAAP